MIKFENTYAQLPPRFYQKVSPASFNSPELLIFNNELASELGMELEGIDDRELANIFSGQQVLPGSEPLAQAYAGFQFGHPVPQLGDGRALLLGETNKKDIQLKGSGQTMFSRGGDGRSALGPVIREYIVSEAMYALGVPTTRALAAVKTGEEVYRQNGPEPGGVFTRVADSHIRVGTFQYFAFQNDLEGIRVLLDYSIGRHYPEIDKDMDEGQKAIEFLKAVTQRQAELVAKWTALGFIHGVMNTDNFSIAGITIDYGPCAFMDEFKHYKVFSSIDQKGRYSFFNQVPIAQWNILRLADCLLPLIDDDQNKAIEILEKELDNIMGDFPLLRWKGLAAKLGITNYRPKDEHLIKLFLDYLEKEELDFTLAFRFLPQLLSGNSNYYKQTAQLEQFLERWKARSINIENLDSINPVYIPRNHLVEQAIRDAYEGDCRLFKEMVEVLKRPFEQIPGLDRFMQPPQPSERVLQTFCGT